MSTRGAGRRATTDPFDHACPFCQAPAGHRCTDPSGIEATTVHVARRRSARPRRGTVRVAP